jgi:Domain of unknown function (DUF1707)
MTGVGGSLATDADRETAAATLAEAVACGQLSLAGHRDRLDRLYAAVTLDQVLAVTAGLPPAPGDRALLRVLGPYRCLLLGGRARRSGRFRVGRFCTLLVLFGTLDLDLRAAQLSQGEVTFTVYGLRARVTVTVPPGARVTDRFLGTGHRPVTDDGQLGPAGSAEAPVIQVRGAGLVCILNLVRS